MKVKLVDLSGKGWEEQKTLNDCRRETQNVPTRPTSQCSFPGSVTAIKRLNDTDLYAEEMDVE